MIQSRLLRRLGMLAALAAGYFVAGKLSLQLAFVNPSASAVWPPAGIALAAFVLLGYDVWPAILAGAFPVNVTTAGSVATSIGIGVGNTLEGLVGAYLVNRFARGPQALDRAQDIFKLTVLAAVVSTTVGATTGVTALSLGGLARWEDYGSIWLTWWLGDAVGDLVVAPAVLLWSLSPRVSWRGGQVVEAGGLLLSVILVGFFVFDGLSPSGVKNYPLEFLCIPLLVCVAFRFSQRESATALVVERREVEGQLRQLAVSDPLTGLANYRQLTNALETEIKRSQRSERPFAVVLLDLNGLKKINDSYGHLVGSLAVRRVAEALLGSCRAIDTAARFGGDEFALVLPETNEDAAWQVARRVAERVARDGEQPPISVSVGVAVYPKDGAALETLVNAADRALYENKGRRRGKSRVRQIAGGATRSLRGPAG